MQVPGLTITSFGSFTFLALLVFSFAFRRVPLLDCGVVEAAVVAVARVSMKTYECTWFGRG